MILKLSNHNRGFTIMVALIIGTVLLLLSVVLYTFVSRQYTGMHIIVNGEVAHFLAETGINTTIGSIRESIGNNFNSGTRTFEKLKEIFLNSKSSPSSFIERTAVSFTDSISIRNGTPNAVILPVLVRVYLYSAALPRMKVLG